MKSKLVEKEVEKKAEYPCLMKSTKTKETLVVLFTGYGEGFVVWAEDSYSFLEGSCDWVMDYFEPFNGTIELSN